MQQIKHPNTRNIFEQKKHKILIIKKSNYWAINYDSSDNQMANDMFLGSFWAIYIGQWYASITPFVFFFIYSFEPLFFFISKMNYYK